MNDTDKLHYVHTSFYSAKAKEIIDSVFGQLSDGWGENNPRYDRYWQFGRACVAENGEVLIEIEKCSGKVDYYHRWLTNGFNEMVSDEDIKQWMAKLIKKTAQMELKDDPSNGAWKRDNENKCVYLGHYDVKHGWIVTFADVYLVYEHLLGRNYSGKYAEQQLKEIVNLPLSEKEIAINAAKAEVEAKIDAIKKEAKEKIAEATKQINKERDEKIYYVMLQLNNAAAVV